MSLKALFFPKKILKPCRVCGQESTCHLVMVSDAGQTADFRLCQTCLDTPLDQLPARTKAK
jgi:hypothetical protein